MSPAVEPQQETPAADTAAPADTSDPQPPQPSAAAEAAEEEQPQEAREARRQLMEHAPEFIVRGSAVVGNQYGVSGGTVHGSVSFTEVHHHEGPAGPAHASGQVRQDRLDYEARRFAEGEGFRAALARLRTERVVVLSGAHDTGRRTAALVLLHRLGIPSVRVLDPETPPGALHRQLEPASGNLLCDPALGRTNPLRENHLLALRDALKEGGHLVITVDSTSGLEDVPSQHWTPPPREAALRAQLIGELGADGDADGDADDPAADALLALDPVREFLARDRPMAEISAFAAVLVRHSRGELPLSAVAGFSLATAQDQVRSWFGPSAERGGGLHDRAFLISLAVLDQAPYVLAAEYADVLFARLHAIERPEEQPEISVFGSSATDRLQRARARDYHEQEFTEWGPVPQRMAAFQDERIARILLSEVWTDHPSARPALVGWLQQMARDRRPLPRTRAAAAAAQLAEADLPSAMALLIDRWATSRSYAARLIAANALTLAQLLGLAAIPRVLHQWCTGAAPSRRWTAIRAYALLCPLRPELAHAALDAFATLARDESTSATERRNLVDSTVLLLSFGHRGALLAELAGLLGQDSAAVRAFVLSAFVTACTEDDENDGLLAWYLEDGVGEERDTAGAQALAALWRTALADRECTREALAALRGWVHRAEQEPRVEAALTELLPELVRAAADRDRLSHLLRTMPSASGGPPPPVAARLLSALTAHR